MCLSADWAGALVPLNSCHSVFDLLLASFLRGCLVGLLSFVSWVFSFFVVSFRVVCWGLCLSACYLFRPALFVLVCRVLFGLCAFLVVFCGVAGLCWPLVVVVFCFLPRLLCAFLLLLCGVASVWPVLSWLRPPLSCPPPRLVLWCLLVQSVYCWSLPPGIWLFLRRPECHACGMECCDGLAPVFTSPHGNKGFGPVWGSALYTMLRVSFRCSSFLR